MTKAQLLSLLEGVDSAVQVKFHAIGAIPADSVVVLANACHILQGEVDRTGEGDTVTVQPLVILQQG